MGNTIYAQVPYFNSILNDFYVMVSEVSSFLLCSSSCLFWFIFFIFYYLQSKVTSLLHNHLKKRCAAHIRNASREGQSCVISCPLTENLHIGKLGNITFWPCTLSWVERSWNTIYSKTHSGYRASTVNDIPFITTQMRTQNDIGKQWTHQKGRESH